ncbi:hypothetical protein [Bacillus thuringiensis]|uniref:Uncharacterized protein n=1 Tax=Bacillus thuringiensis TaxID=1428 RepID=A0AAW4HZE4_BACTU|nr:hypothetical protein [Bacillus thuringiensis]MBN9901369.1 hypothetical protein [Bacillus thuringiensis]MDY7521680.1 hypothetical protein [Bacillus thuringiensis]
MKVILNEISIENKFIDLNDFLNKLKAIVAIYRLNIKELEILKPSNLYSINLFSNVPLQTLLFDKKFNRNDEIRRLKSILSNLIQEEPFWDTTPLHKISDQYKCEFTAKLHSYGIAEACEREKYILSFFTDEFKNQGLVSVEKNGDEVFEVKNIWSKNYLLDELLEKSSIDYLTYCTNRFKKTNLSFDELDEDYGFAILNMEQSGLYINRFKEFSKMSWEQICQSSGLRYKEYSPSGTSWFKGTLYESEKIMKFRVNDKYRCFGYRVGDIFRVLRFEIDHKISDKG